MAGLWHCFTHIIHITSIICWFFQHNLRHHFPVLVPSVPSCSLASLRSLMWVHRRSQQKWDNVAKCRKIGKHQLLVKICSLAEQPCFDIFLGVLNVLSTCMQHIVQLVAETLEAIIATVFVVAPIQQQQGFGAVLVEERSQSMEVQDNISIKFHQPLPLTIPHRDDPKKVAIQRFKQDSLDSLAFIGFKFILDAFNRKTGNDWCKVQKPRWWSEF